MWTFKIIMCCVDERAGGFVLEEGTREDIVKEERKRIKSKDFPGVCGWETG